MTFVVFTRGLDSPKRLENKWRTGVLSVSQLKGWLDKKRQLIDTQNQIIIIGAISPMAIVFTLYSFQ
jgi:hypothetical protein